MIPHPNWHFCHQELTEPQHKLLSYVMEQPYSRDMVCSMLSLNKQVAECLR